MGANFNEIQKMFKTKEYIEHEIFNILNDFIGFYNSLAMNSFNFSTSGVEAVLSIDSYIYSSIAGSLDSIKLILNEGRINDAFALTRKYSDTIIWDIYKAQKVQAEQSIQNLIIKDIDDWTKKTIRIDGIDKMINEIKSNKSLLNLKRFIDFDGHYKDIRKKCNDNSHFNSLYNLMLNDNMIFSSRRVPELSQLTICLKSLFTLHFAYICMITPAYISSSDYIDCIDCGMVPEEGSQYLVAPFAQKTFGKYIVPYNPKLAAYIKDDCGMDLH